MIVIAAGVILAFVALAVARLAAEWLAGGCGRLRYRSGGIPLAVREEMGRIERSRKLAAVAASESARTR